MLQGTFETLSLPEVLGLLASSRKSGALWLEAGPIAGVVHLEDGHCHATVAGDVAAPVDTGAELLARLVDLCFATMCQESGSFRFAADDPAPWWCPEPVELSDALVEVDSLLKQWREILRVIPSLECRPQLLDVLEVEELVIDRERWSLLVAIDGRRTVRELVARSARPVIDVCHVLLELVEAGAIGVIGVIDPAAARAPEPEVFEPQSAPTDEHDTGGYDTGGYETDGYATDGFEPGQFEPAPDPAAAASAEVFEAAPITDEEPMPGETEPVREPELPAAPATDPEPVPDAATPEYAQVQPLAAVGAPAEGAAAPSSDQPDKGAFLRLFSGLRES